MFDFGKVNKVVARHTGFAFYSDFALHVQCPWRLTWGSRILVGSDDYVVKCSVEGGSESGEPERLLTKRFRDMHKSLVGKLKVEKARLGDVGRLTIDFSGDCRLEVLPARSDPKAEFWRVICKLGTETHLVMESGGLKMSQVS
jgi:hypothetical protein